MTTVTERTCTFVVQSGYIRDVVSVHHLCNAPANWLEADNDEPRCDQHCENGRRIGLTEGEEA